MRRDDVEGVLKLFDSVAAERLWIGTEPGYDRDRYRAIFLHGIERDHGMFVASSEGSIIGALTEYPHEEYGRTIGMMVASANRGAGVGQALLEAVFGWGRERKIPSLSLLVFPHNVAALALYRKTGFTEVERYSRDVLRSDGNVWDTLLMRKEL